MPLIDPDFDFRADTPSRKNPNKHRDPDIFSPTLRSYHQILWSKPLPDGTPFTLTQTGKYLRHESPLGVFNLTSDSITHSYRFVKRMQPIIAQIPADEMEQIYDSLFSIGGFTIFPGDKRRGRFTINQARGCNRKIGDRFDLTLECIRRHYAGVPSPLGKTLATYGDFFALFEDFPGFVDFFHFESLVQDDYSAVQFFLPFDGAFGTSPFPSTVADYRLYIKNTLDFIQARTARLSPLASTKKPI